MRKQHCWRFQRVEVDTIGTDRMLLRVALNLVPLEYTKSYQLTNSPRKAERKPAVLIKVFPSLRIRLSFLHCFPNLTLWPNNDNGHRRMAQAVFRYAPHTRSTKGCSPGFHAPSTSSTNNDAVRTVESDETVYCCGDFAGYEFDDNRELIFGIRIQIQLDRVKCLTLRV